jgi:hypothetical protein
MNKKFFWIAALIAALALIFIGCGGGDEESGPPDDVEFWLASDNTGEKLSTLSTTLTGTAEGTEDPVVYIFFTPLGKEFDKIKIDFTLDPGANMSWQCAYDANGTWGQSGNDYIGWKEAGPIDVDPATMFVSGWGVIENGATALDKTSMKGICLRLSPGEGDNVVFTLTDVTFTGVSSGSGEGEGEEEEEEAPYSVDDRIIQLSFKEITKSATLKGTGYQTFEEGKVKIAWNDKDQSGAFRAIVDIAEADRLNLSSGYSKFKMDWTADSATKGNFNISLYFSGNRMLSKEAGLSAEFDFTDVPSWANGWGDAAVGTITGFEIYSDDSGNLGKGTLVINKISFE